VTAGGRENREPRAHQQSIHEPPCRQSRPGRAEDSWMGRYAEELE
jgi:hypothetical protein